MSPCPPAFLRGVVSQPGGQLLLPGRVPSPHLQGAAGGEGALGHPQGGPGEAIFSPLPPGLGGRGGGSAPVVSSLCPPLFLLPEPPPPPGPPQEHLRIVICLRHASLHVSAGGRGEQPVLAGQA